MAIVSIYVLKDPRTQTVRYVGSTLNPKTRSGNHCQNNCSVAVKQWTSELRASRLRPIFEVIEVCTEDNRREIEERWIEHFYASGMLLNVMTTATQRESRKTIPVAVKLVPESVKTLDHLVETWGVSRAGVIEILLLTQQPPT